MKSNRTEVPIVLTFFIALCLGTALLVTLDWLTSFTIGRMFVGGALAAGLVTLAIAAKRKLTAKADASTSKVIKPFWPLVGRYAGLAGGVAISLACLGFGWFAAGVLGAVAALVVWLILKLGKVD